LPNLAQELLTVLAMMAGTAVLHMLGLTGLTRLTRLHIERWRTPWLALDRLLAPLLMVLGLFALHGLEVAAYAAVYREVHAVGGWEAALYLSAGAYSTAGWTGVALAKGWRLLAAFESLNGILLLGWSTAFLFQTLHRILQTEETHPLPEGALAEDPPLGETELLIDEPQEEGAAVAAIASPRRRGSGRGSP
jgi:hypothetical protein